MLVVESIHQLLSSASVCFCATDDQANVAALGFKVRCRAEARAARATRTHQTAGLLCAKPPRYLERYACYEQFAVLQSFLFGVWPLLQPEAVTFLRISLMPCHSTTTRCFIQQWLSLWKGCYSRRNHRAGFRPVCSKHGSGAIPWTRITV